MKKTLQALPLYNLEQTWKDWSTPIMKLWLQSDATYRNNGKLYVSDENGALRPNFPYEKTMMESYDFEINVFADYYTMEDFAFPCHPLYTWV